MRNFHAALVGALFSMTISGSALAQHQGQHGSHGSAPAHSVSASASAETASFDQQFLDTMMVHHQGAIDMAELVATRSSHKGLLRLAHAILADQRSEIDRMTRWKQAWYPGKASAVNMALPGMHGSMAGMSMDKLRAAKGPAFDLLFIDMMVPHHAGAVDMAKDARQRATHPELKAFAASIIQAQTREMQAMENWKKALEKKDK
jgi:uncharacterized protein (DUF305 family)